MRRSRRNRVSCPSGRSAGYRGPAGRRWCRIGLRELPDPGVVQRPPGVVRVGHEGLPIAAERRRSYGPVSRRVSPSTATRRDTGEGSARRTRLSGCTPRSNAGLTPWALSRWQERSQTDRRVRAPPRPPVGRATLPRDEAHARDPKGGREGRLAIAHPGGPSGEFTQNLELGQSRHQLGMSISRLMSEPEPNSRVATAL